ANRRRHSISAHLEKYMNTQIPFKPLISVALLLSALAAGCGGGSDGGGSNTSAAQSAAAAAGRTLTAPPGAGTGPAPVNLMSILTNNFAILTKTGITNTGSHTTRITGNIGSSPISSAAMNNVFCSEITGTIFGVDAAYVGSGSQVCYAGNPPASNKTLVDNAILDLGTAYAD